MFSRTFWTVWGWTLASAVLAVEPAEAHAAWLRFRNDLSHAVVVQSSWTAKGVSHRGKTHYLYPGETVSEWVSEAHSRKVVISDARTPRQSLLQIDASPGKKELLIAVQSKLEAGKKDRVVKAVVLHPSGSETEVSPGRPADPKPKTGLTAKQMPK
jgi:hypothetical protein